MEGSSITGLDSQLSENSKKTPVFSNGPSFDSSPKHEYVPNSLIPQVSDASKSSCVEGLIGSLEIPNLEFSCVEEFVGSLKTPNLGSSRVEGFVGSLMTQNIEPSFVEGLVGSLKTPNLESSCVEGLAGSLVTANLESSCVEGPVVSLKTIKNSLEVSAQFGPSDLKNGLIGDQLRPSCIATETVGSHRRYPSRVRVSAVQNFYNGYSSAPSNKMKGSRNAIVAQIADAESQTTSGKIKKELKNSKRKREEEEESLDENRKIDGNERNHSLHSEVGENLVDKEESKAARSKVMGALSMFETIYKKLFEDEEASCNKSKRGLRADVMAYKIFNQKNVTLSNGRKHAGHIPGVEVGDSFNLRVELCIVGLHRQHRLCVDFIDHGGKCVAVSLVYSRPYFAGIGNSDVLLYSSYGDLTDIGNLALKNSMDARTPVRVIHGLKGYPSRNNRATKATRTVMTYIYDGLYLVEKYRRKKGQNGQYAPMFRLKKISGQPKLVLEESNNPKVSEAQPRVYIDDISEGKEIFPIQVVNTIDGERPKPFKYITRMICPLQYSPLPSKGCECVDGCSDSESCACAVKNGGEIPFNCNGDIVEAKPLVYECGPSCKCPPSCHNRVSQNRMKFQLEIFKTESRGWGVRCRNLIPTGSFICEYIGELLDEKEAQKRTDDDYLFAIGNNYYDEALWEGLNTFIPDLQKGPSSKDDVGFAVDGSEYGNVGRFINHSCTPNIFAQNLLYDHDEKSMPHVVFFAIDDIPPLQELTYDYNYAIDQVHDSDGNIKKKSCYCGSIECTAQKVRKRFRVQREVESEMGRRR